MDLPGFKYGCGQFEPNVWPRPKSSDPRVVKQVGKKIACEGTARAAAARAYLEISIMILLAKFCEIISI